MGLRDFSENIYQGNVPIKNTKKRERDMGEIIRSLENYNPSREKYKTHTLPIAKEFYKRKKMIFIAFGNLIFPLPR